jgi:hypothetical protein
VIRTLNRAIRCALIVGCAGALIWLVSIMLHARYLPSVEAPYPTFGGSFTTCFEVIAALYLTLWGSLSLATIRAARGPDLAVGAAGLALFGGLLMTATCAGLCLGVGCLNALLDFSPTVATPVLVQSTRSEKSMYKKQVTWDRIATVNRLGHPHEAIDVNWNSCGVPSYDHPSPFAILSVGRGAFGVPWIALPVLCKPSQVPAPTPDNAGSLSDPADR